MMLLFVGLAAAMPLDEALRRAVETSEDVAAAAAGLEAAQADQRAALSGALPTVTGSLAYTHTFASEFDDLFGDTGGTNPFGDLPFGQDDTWNAGLSASQGLAQGGRVLAQRRLAGAGLAVASSQLEGARASAALNAATAWYDAALADAVLEIQRATLARAEATLRDAKLAYELGRLAEFDALRASVEAENQRVAVLQQEHAARLAEARLRTVLHLPEGEPLELALPAEPDPAIGERAAAIAGVRAGERAPVTQAEAAADAAGATLALQRSAALPYLGLSASYGLVQYPDGVVPDADWRKNISASVALSVPLVAGGAVKSAVDGARADLRAAELRVESARAYAALDGQQVTLALDSAEARLATTVATEAQAEKALLIAETRFAEGISTQTELVDARLLLEQARINRARAGADLALARIRAALLPALPLSTY